MFDDFAFAGRSGIRFCRVLVACISYIASKAAGHSTESVDSTEAEVGKKLEEQTFALGWQHSRKS